MNSWPASRCVEKRKRNEQEAASEDYPSVQLPTGHGVHVYQAHGEWVVWLNTETSDFDGLCISIGDTRDEALREAVKVFEAAEAALHQPCDNGTASR